MWDVGQAMCEGKSTRRVCGGVAWCGLARWEGVRVGWSLVGCNGVLWGVAYGMVCLGVNLDGRKECGG